MDGEEQKEEPHQTEEEALKEALKKARDAVASERQKHHCPGKARQQQKA